MPTDHPVARYYDRNTLRFLLVGGSGRSHAIHRHLWGEGVTSARHASDYVHRLLEARAREAGLGPGASILDLGCGVGGTLFRLAGAFPGGRLDGVTISARQARLAERLARRKGLGARCRIHLADFQAVRLDMRADLVVAIEAFAHADAAGRFMATAAHHLRPGGRLVLVDDFLTDEEHALEPDARAHVRDLRAGWRVPGLTTVAACARTAAAAGLELVADVDLTPLTRQGRPRDRAIAALGPWLRRSPFARTPFVGNMIGGNALQVGLREGFVRYRMLELRAHRNQCGMLNCSP